MQSPSKFDHNLSENIYEDLLNEHHSSSNEASSTGIGKGNRIVINIPIDVIQPNWNCQIIKAKLAISLSNKTSSIGIELHLLKLLNKMYQWDPQALQTTTKTICCAFQSWQGPIAEDIYKTQETWRSGADNYLYRDFTPTVWYLWYMKVFCMVPKEKNQHQTSNKFFDWHWCAASLH